MKTTFAHHAGSNTGDGGPRSADAVDKRLLVYAWACPACDTYCCWVRIRPSADRLHRLNARESTAVMGEITEARVDIDDLNRLDPSQCG